MKTSISLPDDLWKKAKIRCVEESLDLQDLIAQALEEYLKRGFAKDTKGPQKRS